MICSRCVCLRPLLLCCGAAVLCCAVLCCCCAVLRLHGDPPSPLAPTARVSRVVRVVAVAVLVGWLACVRACATFAGCDVDEDARAVANRSLPPAVLSSLLCF